MRVVAGVARGRTLSTPPGRGTRPTSDKVREAMFSMLTSMDLIEGSLVIDLFAGSGALGIEALSRGAGRVVFVESDAAAIRTIRANLAVVAERSDDAEVVRADALRYAGNIPFSDLVLADPPYRFERWDGLFDALHARTAVLVAESDHPLDTGPAWETVKVRKYGGTVVTVAQPVVHVGGSVRLEGEI